MNKKQGTTWGLVVMMFIIFWPLGLFLLIKKLKEEKAALFSNVVALRIVAALEMFIFVSGFMTSLRGNVTHVVNGKKVSYSFVQMLPSLGLMFIIFALGGIILWIYAGIIEKKAKKFRKYIELIVNESVTDIDVIAKSMNKNVEITLKEITEMIDKKLLNGIVLNEDHTELVLKDDDRGADFKIIQCQNCDANNKVYSGDDHVCAYCGASLDKKSFY